MKRQKGQAFILAVIWLGVGALLITPALAMAYSGLKSQRISENALNAMLNDDSALQTVLWNLLNNGMGTFTPGGSIAYDFSYAGRTYNSTITIPSVPPSTVMTEGKVTLLIDPQPQLIESTANGTNYVIRITTEPWSSSAGTYVFDLPEGFTYAANSAYVYGPAPQNEWLPDPAVFLAAEVDTTTHMVMTDKYGWRPMIQGCGSNPSLYHEVYQDPPPGGYLTGHSYLVITNNGRHLKFKPDYSGNTGGNRKLIQTVHANGNAWGVHYVTGGSFAVGSDTVLFDQTAAVGVAMYTVVINVGGVNYRLTIAYDTETGTFKIVSYQIL